MAKYQTTEPRGRLALAPRKSAKRAEVPRQMSATGRSRRRRSFHDQPLATASEAPVDGSEGSDQTRRRRSQRGVGAGTRKDADETSILGSAEGYASVLAVIKAFCENDESLQDATKQLRYARGAVPDGTSPDARVKAAEAEFKELIRVECLGGQGSCVSASDIERAVRTVVLHATTSSWDEYFGALERYKGGQERRPELSGLRRPRDRPEARMAYTQRQLKKRKKNPLDPEPSSVWNVWACGGHRTWDEYFGALERYKEGPGNGDANCPWLRRPDTESRRAPASVEEAEEESLDPERVERLERLGVRWEQPDTWDEYFGALERYKEGPGNGDPNCVQDYVDPDTGLKLGVAYTSVS